MFWLTISCVAGVAFGQLPNYPVLTEAVDPGNYPSLTEAVDQGFRLSDLNRDGILQMSELEAWWQTQDLNHDNQLTVEEVMKALNYDRYTVQTIFFDIYDQDGDGKIPHSFIVDYVHMLDHNGDGQITLKEYEQFTVSIAVCLSGDGNHGDGANCSYLDPMLNEKINTLSYK
ncbi:uncharacterized protein LOC127838519 [Dreissena polymorpha]|uniref:EF-hand domain-containing protein n=1 Tax=Dreissena polymorpha TaxID=45954 RepID=A0A9D4FTP5_DREPO|nr:uncharacterized protein LOC127838519 [Dreissena polymorpha]KAH3803038.1 hypothetical protein DPMN_156736 [Dreissena polymorpha]